MDATTIVNQFLSAAGLSSDLASMLHVEDACGDLVLIQHDLGQQHPVASTIEGYIYDTVEGKVVVKGEAPMEDVLIGDDVELLEQLKQNPHIYEHRQTTHLRLYEHKGTVHCSTNKKLDAFDSMWGSMPMFGESFGSLLLKVCYASDMRDIYEYYKDEANENGCVDLFLESTFNQLVTNDSVGDINGHTCYTRNDLLALYPSHDETTLDQYTISSDIYWIDYRTNTRYLSKSMYYKLHTVRNPVEPNVVKRLFILKGNAYKLIDVVPHYERDMLRTVHNNKNDYISAYIDAHGIPNELIPIMNANKSLSVRDAFFKLPGLTQYELLFHS